MTVPSLPLAPEEFARRLSRPLASADDARRKLSVTKLDLVEVPNESGLALRVDVAVTTPRDPDVQRWRVDIPVEPEMFDPDVTDTSALMVIIRANLEEWWDVKDRPQEARIAAWGRRLE